MSEFLLIVPSDWTQIDLDRLVAEAPECQLGAIDQCIRLEQYGLLTDAMHTLGMIADDKTVVAARLIDQTYLMVRLG